MRKFTCDASVPGLNNVTLDAAVWRLDAIGSGRVAAEIIDALADLEVGHAYVDSDGDTWERTE